jgi:hypothetical protein
MGLSPRKSVASPRQSPRPPQRLQVAYRERAPSPSHNARNRITQVEMTGENRASTLTPVRCDSYVKINVDHNIAINLCEESTT